MKIRILCVGKIKEKFMREALGEYSKRLSRYIKLEITEVVDEKTPDSASEKEENQIRDKEAERLLKQIRQEDYVIALAIDGKMYDSVAFSKKLDRFGVLGRGSVVFVIGGSLGLGEQVLERADESISFSKMTFPHQLMRVILLEQIYRGYRILRNEPYHK
ncbi:MAG: 23S rRNA (pseudouridine(1915)-N(3))-methyltransferase RlmH [Eubacterium sp.]|jgi:23S rRNA (pseudouridine1915-N3)-methyltransferase|nr:23S rRNA (pseudouridine(1915)-N(3))-methyltransferase RlmH [Eubacterium sp.]